MRISLITPSVHERRSGKRDLGDGHGATRAHLAQILAMACEAARKVNSVDQLIRGEAHCVCSRCGILHKARVVCHALR